MPRHAISSLKYLQKRKITQVPLTEEISQCYESVLLSQPFLVY